MESARRVAAVLLLLAAPFGARAQEGAISLTLQECIRLAQTNGPFGAMARSAYERKVATHSSFAATHLPQLSLQGEAPGYYRSINPVVLPDGATVFTPQSEASSSLGLSLTQKIPLTGGLLSVSSSVNRIDLMESRTQYYRSKPLTLSLSQPLFQINTMRWDREEQDIRYAMASRELAEAMEECAIDITNRFFEVFLASMSSSNAASNVAINDTLYRISRGRFNVGKIAENDLLQSELAYLSANTQLENANVSLERALQRLKTAIGVDSATSVELVPPTEIATTPIDPAAALAHARSNRSDMLDFDLQLLTAERAVVQAKSDNGFNATMTASFGYNQRAPLLPDAYRNLLEQDQFTVGFSVPVFRWGAGSAAVDAALASQKGTETSVEEQRRDFEQEVLYQAARLNLLQKQVAVAAKSDTIAQRRFEVAKERYVIGKIDIPILFIAQSEKDNARRANFQTLWDYWSTHFRVRRLILHDFVTGESLVESGADD